MNLGRGESGVGPLNQGVDHVRGDAGIAPTKIKLSRGHLALVPDVGVRR